VSWHRWASLGGGLGLLAIVAGVGAYQLSWQERILPHVAIDGQPVGGLSLGEARQRTAQTSAALTGRTLTATLDGRSWQVSAGQLGFSYDVEGAVGRAFSIGHGGQPLGELTAQLALLRQPADVDLKLLPDRGRIAAWAQGIAREVDQPLREAGLTVAGGEVRIDAGQDGRSVDLPAFEDAILAWAASDQPAAEIAVPLTAQPRTLTASQLEPAAAQLRAALTEAPVQLELDGKSWTIPAASIHDALSWSLSAAGELQLELDAAKLRPALSAIAPQVERTAQDAKLVWKDGGLTASGPSADGRRLDVDGTIAAITQAIQRPEHRASLAVVLTPAKISSADLPALGIRELVAEGKSNFSYSPWERVVNVKKMASLLNGVLVAPGEEFSFNKVMGDIDPRDGWATGLVILGGRTVPGVGGGICQVSTTAFRGAFWAGLPITERHDHDYPVPYYTQGGYPEGFDATVWSPDLDFKFRNDTPGYLLIQTTIDAASSNLTVSFYGTKVPGRTVTMDGPFISNVRPAPAPRHIVDPSKPVGYVNQTDFPHPGSHVVLRRIVEDASGQHVDEFVSNYTPWSAVFIEGPKPDAPPADAAADSDAAPDAAPSLD